jgi:16S rRNA (cytidine1402-2'-O)-methyltransferase
LVAGHNAGAAAQAAAQISGVSKVIHADSEALAHALAVLGERWVTVGRELTKQFEEIATLRADALVQWLADDANRLRGEFALVLHPAPATNEVAHDDRILKLLLEQLPLKTAVKLAADISGEPRNALYERALALKTPAPD